MIIALGDTWRPGHVDDVLDMVQVQEMILMGELVTRCRQANVQVMVKGPGVVPLHLVGPTVLLQKTLCHGAPLLTFGPVVTGIDPDRQHVAAAIGGAAAAAAGADAICAVPPGASRREPQRDDLRASIAAARIAAHVGDLAKDVAGAAEWDCRLSVARRALNWREQFRLALDPDHAKKGYRDRNAGRPRDPQRRRTMGPATCSMCGEYCPMALSSEYLKGGS